MDTARWRAALAAAALLAAALVAPRAAHAQACFGVPTRDGGGALSAGIAFPENGTSYGGALRVDAPGALTAGASYSLTSHDDVDPKQHNVGGEVGFELPLPAASFCPTVGVSYSRISEEGTSLSVLTVPVGVGLGVRLPAGPGVWFIPHAVPQLLWMRASIEDDFLGEASETDTEFGAVLGLTLAVTRIFVAGQVVLTTVDESEPVFGIGLGVAF